MEVRGLCNICGKAGKMHTCILCGNIVCKDCYDFSLGVCKLCKQRTMRKQNL
ncbi:MAG: orotate phosphoribosyltransferase [Euryarchaeota archaeon]|nr:orotate phosphoribosyltransferase [Euryarchaeota archaeon]